MLRFLYCAVFLLLIANSLADVVYPQTCGGEATPGHIKISDCALLPCKLVTKTIVEIQLLVKDASSNAYLTITPIGSLAPALNKTIGTLQAGGNSLEITDFDAGGIPPGLVSLNLELFNDRYDVEICYNGQFDWQVVNFSTVLSSSLALLVLTTLVLGALQV